MAQTALQGIGINYDWNLRADDWKPGMDANLAIINGILGNNIQAVTDTEPTVSAAPDTTNAGKAWLVGDTPTGAWATGKANHIAIRNGSTATWIFIAPHKAYGPILDLNTGEFMRYNGTTWVADFTDANTPLPATGFFLQALTNTPPTPSSPADNGKCWAVDSAPTGAWAGQAGKMAMWYVPPGLGTGQWKFIQPQKGWRALSDTVPFDDALGLYGYTQYRDFYLHNGTAWELDPLLRVARGPVVALDLSPATPGVQYIRVLTIAEASAGSIAIALAAPDTEIILRVPQAALPFVPNTQLILRSFTDRNAKVTLQWGDGTEVPGTMGDVGSDPGLGDAEGSPDVALFELVPDIVIPMTPAIGYLSVTRKPAQRIARDVENIPKTLVFTAGNYDLSVPDDMGSSVFYGGGDLGKLLITDEASPNTVTIRNNPVIFAEADVQVLKFRIAQKGVGATTIVLDNTVTGTDNTNDVLDAIAPDTMSVGESRVLRFVPDGGTGGLGHKWIITHS